MIKGWDAGVEGMRVGDVRKLVIPPQMAYGSQRTGPIPPNSTLEFEVIDPMPRLVSTRLLHAMARILGVLVCLMVDYMTSLF